MTGGGASVGAPRGGADVAAGGVGVSTCVGACVARFEPPLQPTISAISVDGVINNVSFLKIMMRFPQESDE
jgi:hypothetical protein